MSDRFADQLADFIFEHLEDRPPRGGQILLTRFHRGEVANSLCEALLEEIEGEPARISVDDEEVELPAYRAPDGTPLYIVRVVDNVSGEQLGLHEVTQGFATRMRNLIAESVHEGEPKAMLMVLEQQAALDTLEASDDLLGEDGPLNLAAFRQRVLDPATCPTAPGRAVLSAVKNLLEEQVANPDDVTVLDAICDLRAAVNQEDGDALSTAVARLPGFIQEDLFRED